jgi:hypothetical protein
MTFRSDPSPRPLRLGPKAYPLDIETCSSDDERAILSKGHHDPDAFMTAARADGFDVEWARLGQPQHIWYRKVPDRTGDRRCWYVEAAPRSRGAFPVTVAWETSDAGEMYGVPMPPVGGWGVLDAAA